MTPRKKKSWQSRMTNEQNMLAVNFVESITFDNRLYTYDIAGSIAHATMLSEIKLITKSDLIKIKKALKEIEKEIASEKFKFDVQYEDIHMIIEDALIKKIGDVGKKLHTGRSRNDQVALDMRLWMRDEIVLLIDKLHQMQLALVTLAEIDGHIVMPGYTHLQRAQPIVAGHTILVFAEQVERDKARLIDLYKRVNVCPLGSGALAGSSLPLNRKRVAELLKFASITRNSIDSTSDRDFCAEFLFICSMIGMHLSRLAEEWILYSTEEFGFIKISDAFSTGSSMMPQKRNPDMLELLRGKTGSLYGNLIATLTMLKGQPLAYNRDMQEDKRHLFASSDSIESCLDIITAIILNTRLCPERIADGLENGFLDATAFAEYLVRKGVPFREAHHISGSMVGICEKQQITIAELPLKEMQKLCKKIDKDVLQYLGTKNVVAQYAVEGSGGIKQLKKQIAFWKKQLAKKISLK